RIGPTVLHALVLTPVDGVIAVVAGRDHDRATTLLDVDRPGRHPGVADAPRREEEQVHAGGQRGELRASVGAVERVRGARPGVAGRHVEAAERWEPRILD